MFVVEKKPKSIAAEAYRSLRTNIQYSSIDEKYRVIVVTSSEPAEGKSTTAGNLALVLAQSGKQVLLVDCDMRKPSVHKKFKISNMAGLSDLLINKCVMEEVAFKFNNNLDVVTSGSIPPNPSEMLASKRMEKYIEEMKEHYDYVVLDTPPLQAVTDAQILSTKADGTILVVKAEKTKKESVANAVSLLKKVNSTIIGTVLNDMSNKNNKYYYYYGEDENGKRVKKK